MQSPTPTAAHRIGIDTGGTFTDLVVVDDATGERRTVKVSSTPGQPSAAVFQALERSGVAPEELASIVLGTTVATNCLLQRRGQRTVYVTTGGFEDIPHVQRINRPGLHTLQWVKHRAYVAPTDCIGVAERVRADGSVHAPLEEAEIARVVEELRARLETATDGIAVAVNLLFAYANPEHERRLAEGIRAALAALPISLSSEVAPIWREYERGNTVLVDAYLKALVGRFSLELVEGAAARGIDSPFSLLKSNGGQVSLDAAAHQPVHLIVSGLAGGLIAGRHYAERAGTPDAITLDMGGTSADVGVVAGGAIRSRNEFEFEFGLPIAVPVVDLTTIGAGGSSIAGFDQGGFLKVGPESAGANPGPASYGLGGAEATVTDANLVLGRLNPGYFLGGELGLDLDRARAVIAPVAERLGVDEARAAMSILEVATENMANAIRLVAADRGLDYRRFDLVAFGGAGPLDAAELARRVGMARIVVPPNPGLTSAYGALLADQRVDRRMTRVLRSDLATAAEVRGALEQVAAEALDDLRREGVEADVVVVLSASCRYLGQNFEQDVVVSTDAGADLLDVTVRSFHESHERAYGYRIEDAVVEMVNFSALAFHHRDVPPPGRIPELPPPTPVARRVFFKGPGWVDAAIYRRPDLGAGFTLRGPAVVEEVDSTTVVLGGQELRVEESGIMILTEASDV